MQNIAQNQEEKVTSENSRPRSSTTTVYTQPGVFQIPPDQLEIVRQYYEDVLGPLNMLKAKDIEWAFKAGLDCTAICDALEQTAFARKPTHYYFRAIINRYAEEGITTSFDALKEREQRKAERYQSRKHEGFDWYSNPDDFMPF